MKLRILAAAPLAALALPAAAADAPARPTVPQVCQNCHKPAAGELRGIALVNLIQMDVDALARVLPRITEPTLTEVDVNRMDPADLMQAGSVVAGFLLPASARPASLDA